MSNTPQPHRKPSAMIATVWTSKGMVREVPLPPTPEDRLHRLALAATNATKGHAPSASAQRVSLPSTPMVRLVKATGASPAWSTNDPEHVYARGHGWAARTPIEPLLNRPGAPLALPPMAAMALLEPHVGRLGAWEASGQVRWYAHGRYVTVSEGFPEHYEQPWRAWEADSEVWSASLPGRGLLDSMFEVAGGAPSRWRLRTKETLEFLVPEGRQTKQVPVRIQTPLGSLGEGSAYRRAPTSLLWAMRTTGRTNRPVMRVSHGGMVLLEGCGLEVLLPQPH